METFASLWWSPTEPAVSRRFACTPTGECHAKSRVLVTAQLVSDLCTIREGAWASISKTLNLEPRSVFPMVGPAMLVNNTSKPPLNVHCLSV